MSENGSKFVAYLIEGSAGESFLRRFKVDADDIATSLPRPVIVSPLVRALGATALSDALACHRKALPVPVNGNYSSSDLLLMGYDHAIRVIGMALLQEDPALDLTQFYRACGAELG